MRRAKRRAMMPQAHCKPPERWKPKARRSAQQQDDEGRHTWPEIIVRIASLPRAQSAVAKPVKHHLRLKVRSTRVGPRGDWAAKISKNGPWRAIMGGVARCPFIDRAQPHGDPG